MTGPRTTRLFQMFGNYWRQPSQILSDYWRQPPYLKVGYPLIAAATLVFAAIARRRIVLKRDEPAFDAVQEMSKPCRYRLDNDTSATFTLPDGRKIGYATYGSPTGRPVLWLHGWPGSRVEVAFYDEAAKKIGARLIGIDRPGTGWSSPQPNRTILDHAKDVRQLAEHLELEDYGVLGISGGGPYALACAQALPADKLKVVSIVCGLGPPDIGYWGMKIPNYLGWTLGHTYMPGLIRWWMKRQAPYRLELSDEKRLELWHKDFVKEKKKAKPKDTECFEKDPDLPRLFMRHAKESFLQGLDGPSQDGHLLATDSSYRVEDIRHDLPLQLWYGKQDTNVPANHGVQIAARFGGKAQLRVEDETHLSMEVNYKEEILTNLVKAMG